MTPQDIINMKSLANAAIRKGVFEDLESSVAIHQSIAAIENFYYNTINNGNKEKSNSTGENTGKETES